MKFPILLLDHVFKTIIALGIAACSSNTTDGKTQTLDLSYIAWGCECANWATMDDIRKYRDRPDSLAARCVFIEPAENSLKLPDSVGYNGDVIRFTGQFCPSKGYPKGYSLHEKPAESSVFRYTSYQIIKSNFTPDRIREN